MKRRTFLTSTAAVTALGAASGQADEKKEKRQFIELRTYISLYGEKKRNLDTFLREAAIPAWNRQGIGPVGVFTPQYGLSEPSVYVLLPHDSMESVVTSTRKLLEDEEFLEKGKEFLNVSSSDASYFQVQSSLMWAFKDMPNVEVPQEIEDKKGRIFELRIYQSHSEIKAKKKIEMFNEGGEIAIFRKTGLHPVFFGESIVGPRLPNLTYMLGFESMEQRDKHWDQFRTSPEWKELSRKSEYADTVSNISDIILRPKGFSQI
jgi:hypothetical protein